LPTAMAPLPGGYPNIGASQGHGTNPGFWSRRLPPADIPMGYAAQ